MIAQRVLPLVSMSPPVVKARTVRPAHNINQAGIWILHPDGIDPGGEGDGIGI